MINISHHEIIQYLSTMNFITEVSEGEQSILIVDPKSRELARLLAQEIKKYGGRLYYSSQLPPSLERFDCIFLIDQALPPHYKPPPAQKNFTTDSR